MQFSKIFLSENTMPRAFIFGIQHRLEVLYQSCSKMPLGSKLTPHRGHNFTLNYIRKSLNDIFYGTANGYLTKLNRNGPWVVPYRNCSNGSDWLHKQVTGSKNRFSKCNFQKSCLKLQGPGLLYLVYSIIQRSSTKVVQIMLLGSKLTPPRGSQFYIELYKKKFKRLLLLNR